VLPRDAWLEISESWAWSLHLATGGVLGQLLLFALAGVAATGLMVGFRPRLCAATCYLLWLSLHFRNPLVSDFGDWTLLVMLMWAAFLPTSSPRWPWERVDGPASVRSVATAALLAQLLLIYSSSAAHKARGAGWASGAVLPAALQLKAMSTSAGLWLAEHPGLCAGLSTVTLALELLGPLLLFLPWRNGAARLAVAIAFIGLHLSMRLFLRLGLFTVYSLVPWLAVLPAAFWDRMLKRTEPAAEGIADDPLPRFAKVLVIALLGIVAVWSVGTASPAAGTLQRAQPFTGALGLAHSWSMFGGADYVDGWFRAPATLASGAKVDLLTGEPPVEGPPEDPAKSFGDRRWRNYQQQLRGGVAPSLWAAWANLLCTRHQRDADPPVEVQLDRVVEPPGQRGQGQREIVVSGKCRR
jgi:hypothetical protein